MRRFRCAALAAVAVVGFASVASAADWTGFYVGGNAGYAWGKSDLTSNFTCSGPVSCPYNNPVNFALFSNGASGSPSANGFTGGVQAGYNWQAGSAVYGIETDFNAFNLKGSVSGTGFPFAGIGQTYTSSASTSTDWLFTFRGRLGWTVTPAALLYATGGLAVTNLKVSNSFADNSALFGFPTNFVGASSGSRVKAGYTVGAGLEWVLKGSWTAKAEYLYVDFGSVGTTLLTNGFPPFAPNADAMATSASLHANIFRVGINYKLN